MVSLLTHKVNELTTRDPGVVKYCSQKLHAYEKKDNNYFLYFKLFFLYNNYNEKNEILPYLDFNSDKYIGENPKEGEKKRSPAW